MRVNLATFLATAFAAVFAFSAARPAPDGGASGWLHRAATAMGGETMLRSIAAIEVSGIEVWHHREQSERPEGPWIPTFVEFTDVRSLAAGAVRRTMRTRGFVTEHDTAWSPESTLLLVDGGALRATPGGLAPADEQFDTGVLPADLGPERVVVAALDARDLHAEPDVVLHSYAHHVAAFTHDGARARHSQPAEFSAEGDREWRVSKRTIVGAGPNRLEIYPLRTVSGERQMMVYFPVHKLLYTSDLFTIRGDQVFLPSMVGEAVDAVAREHLEVTRAFGMHYDALPWQTVVKSAAPR